MGQDIVRIEKDRLTAFCAKVFIDCGVPADKASCQAEVLVAADARGIPSHGVARLQRYVAGLESGQMLADAEPLVLRESSGSLLVDARGGLGAPVSVGAMASTIEKARNCGIAFATVRNSNHFGIAGYYAMMALKEDMIGLAMTNTAALGVPTFGRQVMFGTNPLAFAAPAGKEKAFVLDMATTVVTRGKIETYGRLGKNLPPGWAVDAKGATALQPGPLLEDMLRRAGGGIVPLGGESETHGGHKGYGLAVMVDILTGLLSGGGFGAEVKDTEISSARVSHCFAAMRIDLFQEPAAFKTEMDRLLGSLRNCPWAEDADRVYYAGLKEAEAEEEAVRKGVALEVGVFRTLEGIAKARGIEAPPAA
ncbi:MAG: Ldh family oxidoreductase [Spirochaetes bacterium]|nr:Ldh family oxidoreductase [Spirochaetota bacterium]